MSRRRDITTDISTDDRVAELAERAGLLAVVLYTWMIPHADDDATLRGTPRQIRLKVIPSLPCSTQDVEAALEAMLALGLIEWDREHEVVGFPPEAFYKYQTYINKAKRRTLPLAEYLRQSQETAKEQQETPHNTNEPQTSAENSREQQRTAQKSTSPSPSPTPTLSVHTAASVRSNGGGADPAAAAAVVDVNLKRIQKAFAKAYGDLPNGLVVEELASYIEDGMAPEVVEEALRRAAEANARSWHYARRILDDWLKAGVLSLGDVRTLDAAREANKARASPPKPKPEPCGGPYVPGVEETRRLLAEAEARMARVIAESERRKREGG